MCAIFGIVGKFDKEKALQAANTLAHRGKDSCGVYEDENILLFHHRLYILDPNAKQPMQEGSRVVVFNGEIYNYKDFGVSNDTQAILKSYPNFSKLDGIFAFGLFDGKRLYLAKDIFGKKPIYFYKGKEFFIFASEIKAILAYIGEAQFNQKALSSFLSFGSVVGRESFYQGVFKLIGGEVLELDCKSLKYSIKRFDTLLQRRDCNLQEVLVNAVAKRLQGDFEVAALLSGGVDSSFVSAIAKRKQGRLATYSIGYKEQKYSELPFAKEVAEHIRSDHNEVIFTREDFFEVFERLLEHFDEPIGDSASLPLYFLMQQIKQDGFRVVLSGEGGDEIFLGYRQYFEFLDLYRAKDLKYKNWLKNYFRSHFNPNKEWEWYKRVFSDELIFRSSTEVFTDLQKNLFLRQNVKDGESVEFLELYLQEWQESRWSKEIDFFTFLDLRVRLESLYLQKLDLTGMAHTIEARTPLLDKSLLFCAFAKEERGKEAKFLLKEIAKNYIPQSIIERKKRGFSYPVIKWIQNSRYIERIKRINQEVDFFDTEQLNFLIQSVKRNRFSRHFWLVIAFLLWFERRFL